MNISDHISTSNEQDPFELSGIMKEVDSIIARQMHELSHQDREESYLDLHGVSSEIMETPELISNSLQLMKLRISEIQDNKDAYNLALSLDANYVENTNFQMKFLRGERFNATSAAAKLVRHFQIKRELFGSSKLVKDITQDDLEPADSEALYSGFVQWLPIKDPAGRTVSIYFPLVKVPTISKMRVSFYLRMMAMEDEETQRKGFLILLYAKDLDDLFQFDQQKDLAAQLGKGVKGLPGTFHGVHILFPDFKTLSGYIYASFLQILSASLNPLLKVRMRIHRGSTFEECASKLQQFGIPTDVIPSSPQDNAVHFAVLTKRRRLEQQRLAYSTMMPKPDRVPDALCNPNECISNMPFVISPTPSDIILGRRGRKDTHPGNLMLRSLVEDSKAMYDASSKKEKTLISEKIVSAINTRGRFLRANEFGWQIVPGEEARLKVSHLFRDLYKTQNSKSSEGKTPRVKRSRSQEH